MSPVNTDQSAKRGEKGNSGSAVTKRERRFWAAVVIAAVFEVVVIYSLLKLWVSSLFCLGVSNLSVSLQLSCADRLQRPGTLTSLLV